MSDKESNFIKILSTVLGGFLLALILGGFTFYTTTLRKIDVQDERIMNTAQKVETMRLEWRQDQEKINMNIDKIATRLNEQAGYTLRQGR